MALGDVVQNIGFSIWSTSATLPGSAVVGNSIVVFSNADDAGLTCSDDLNGSYTKIATAGTGPRVSIFLVTNTSAASAPVITLSASGRRSYAMEIEGELTPATGTGTAFLSPLSVGPTSFSTSTNDIPANSVSVGGWGATVDGSGITPDSPWAGVPGNNVTYPFFERQDASAVTGGAFSGTYDGFDGTFDAAVAFVSLVSAGGPSGPTLDTVPATAYPGQSRTIAVTNAGATQGTGGVTIGGVAQTITAWSDTSITFTTVQGNNKYEAGKTIELTTDGGDTASDTIELIVEPGTGGYVDVVDPAVSDESSLAYQFETAGGDPVATGDQCEWRYTGVGGDPTSMTVQADTLVSDVDAEGDVDVRFWDATDSTWGTWTTLTAEVPVVDETGPTVTSADVPADGSYKAGDTLSLTVNTDENATVSGTPSIPLNIGGTTRQAEYASGSGTQALVFNYTVQAGDNDANGIGIGSSISLNGGTIQDSSGNDATLTLNSVGSTEAVLIDTVKPVITPVGANPATVLLGETYTDQDATAFDDQDGSLGNVTGTGLVDENTEGQYTITYSGAGVVDSAGNVADDATRIVNVVAELPTIPTRKKRNRRIVRKSMMLGAWQNRFAEDDEDGR